MLTRIMKHEWRMLVSDRTLAGLVSVFALIVIYGLHNGTSWTRFLQEIQQAVQEEEIQRLGKLKEAVVSFEQGKADKGVPDPRSAASVGASTGTRSAFLPTTALAVLTVGQSDLYPSYFKVTTRSKDTIINHDEIENPTNLLTGRFDLAFVMIALYPLLILAISYNLLSGERENGTLALLLSQPVALRTYLLGKISLRLIVVLLLAVAFTSVGALMVGISPTNTESLWRFTLWTGMVMAYGLFWFSVAMVVNAFGMRSGANALVSIGVWLAFVVVIPSFVTIAVTTLYPVPSRVELVQAIRAASTEANAKGSRLLAKYYEDHPELVPEGAINLNDFATRSYAAQEEVERQIQPVLARYDEQLIRQQAWVDQWRFVSPAIVAQEALNVLSGTSVARYRHFLNQVDAFHREWQSFFIPKIFQRVRLTSADIEAMPRFTFVEESSGAVIGKAITSLFGLILPACLIGWIAIVRLRRYPLSE